MPHEQPMIDLIAVAYNAPAETERFLDSLHNVGVPFRLTILDNNSPDATTREVIADRAKAISDLDDCTEVVTWMSGENHGYARACNYGASTTDAPYLALLNCDIEFTNPECVQQIVAHFESHDDIGVIGPRTTDSYGRLTHAGIFRDPTGRDTHRAWLAPDDVSSYRDTRDVPTVSGATYFVRRSAWDVLTACQFYQDVAPGALGAFLPTQHFYEETWCSYHMHAHGYRVVYMGEPHMVHQWHKSSPVGSQPFQSAEDYFRKACVAHGIELTF